MYLRRRSRINRRVRSLIIAPRNAIESRDCSLDRATRYRVLRGNRVLALSHASSSSLYSCRRIKPDICEQRLRSSVARMPANAGSIYRVVALQIRKRRAPSPVSDNTFPPEIAKLHFPRASIVRSPFFFIPFPGLVIARNAPINSRRK